MISFLSSNRLSALWGPEAVTNRAFLSASKRVANLQRKMGLPLTSEAEETEQPPITAVKREGEELEGKKTMAESHCEEGFFISISAAKIVRIA